MTRILTWYLMLWKRLLKKPGFIITLLLIPLLAFLLNISSSDKGFLRVAIAFEGETDSAAEELTQRLESESEMIRFVISDDPESAIDMAESGEADAAWVFKGELESAVARGVAEGDIRLATVYQREENIFLKLTREKIFCTLFPEISYQLYRDHITTRILPDTELTEEELREAYINYDSEEKLVDFVSPEDSIQADSDYLTTPLRGLCAILMLMCGMAATMYYLKDEAEGSFCLLDYRGRFVVLAANNLFALATAAIFATPALILSGNYGSFLPETLAMIMLVITCTLFCTLLGALVPRIRGFGLLLPLVLVVSVVFCPIFIKNIKALIVQVLLPVYHYMYAVSDTSRLWHMLIYTVIALPLAYIIYMITRKQTA